MVVLVERRNGQNSKTNSLDIINNSFLQIKRDFFRVGLSEGMWSWELKYPKVCECMKNCTSRSGGEGVEVNLHRILVPFGRQD